MKCCKDKGLFLYFQTLWHLPPHLVVLFHSEDTTTTRHKTRHFLKSFRIDGRKRKKYFQKQEDYFENDEGTPSARCRWPALAKCLGQKSAHRHLQAPDLISAPSLSPQRSGQNAYGLILGRAALGAIATADLPNVFGASTAARTAREAPSARRFAQTEKRQALKVMPGLI